MTDNKKGPAIYGLIYVDGRLVGGITMPQVTEKTDTTENITHYEVKQKFFPAEAKTKINTDFFPVTMDNNGN